MPKLYQPVDRGLPAEQGARRKDTAFWTRGASARERSRSPWDPRNHPKPKFVVPKYDPRPHNPNPDVLPDHVRRQIERERKGTQWTQTAGRAIRNAVKVADLLGYEFPGGKFGTPEFDFNFAGYYKYDGMYPPVNSPNGIWLAMFASHHADPQFQLGGQSFGLGGFASLEHLANFNTGTQVSTNTVFGVGDVRPFEFMLGWTVTEGAHWIEHSSYQRLPGEADQPWTVQVIATASPAVNEMPDPNVERLMPASPSPEVIQPALLEVPLETPWGVDDNFPYVSPLISDMTASWPENAAFATPYAGPAPNTSAPMVPTNPAPIAPPPPRERQRKVISRSKAIGIAIYKALDKASEASDVVDAVYEALPEDVKDRWKCNRRAGPVDNFGQYGMGNVDCKLQALWHNWHRLNPEEAVKNIVKNELEDKIYGAIHSKLPKQGGGPAMEGAWRSFADGMKKLGF